MATIPGKRQYSIMDLILIKSVGRSGSAQTGAVMGAAAYIPPEQVRGKTLDLLSMSILPAPSRRRWRSAGDLLVSKRGQLR